MSETWGEGEEDRRSFGGVAYRECRYCDREMAQQGSRLCARCARDEDGARLAWILRCVASGALVRAEHDDPGPFCLHVAKTKEEAAENARVCHQERLEWARRERELVPLRIAAKRREERRRAADREIHAALEARLIAAAAKAKT